MSDKFLHHPFEKVPQGGFTPEKGGDLRDHDGCYAGSGFTATKHYDGDYGSDRPSPEAIGKKQGFKVAAEDRDPKPAPKPEVTKMGMLKAVLSNLGGKNPKGDAK